MYLQEFSYLRLDFCGLLGLPVDFTVEWEPPAKVYQTCLPQVFRNINTVTRLEDEFVKIADGERPNVTDNWEVVHFEAASPAYDHETAILQGLGFEAAITAPEIDRMIHLGGDTTTVGYYDEYGILALWHYLDHIMKQNPRPRMYISWLTVTTHTPFHIFPGWSNEHYQPFVDDKRWDSTNNWLNAVRWSDDKVKEIIEGFRERGLENETLFVMYALRLLNSNDSHGDHGFPFMCSYQTTIENPHNEAYQTRLLLYNPNIKNPQKRKMEGNFYSLSLPTTILDLMVYTKSFAQSAQQALARRFAENYEFAQSLLRPVKQTLRMFLVHPGGTRWIVDNGRNLRVPYMGFFDSNRSANSISRRSM